MKKTLLLLALTACCLSLQAQVNASQKSAKHASNGSYYKEQLEKKKFTHEADFYLGMGWGIGYQLRKEFNPYIGWNIIGIST